ncbi:MAG: hypothetical protein JWN77_1241 [Frankiales bacterium]|nr:hypothetical protein [Frankiales bacterium]
MRRLAVLVTAALLAPAVPSFAGGSTVVRPVVEAVQLPADGLHRLVAGERLVGVTWTTGTPRVEARWHTAAGWSGWTKANDDSDEPEVAERAGTRRGTEPLWRPTGADQVQVRLTGAATGTRLVRVLDGTAKRVRGAVADARSGAALLGDVGSRADWGADESIRDKHPSYADRVDAVVVHHTAQGNDYAQADVPALIRADYAYHVKGRGWGDLGYNLLVDRFGGIWEGRAGGLGRATIGAHAQGFNTRTLGVSLIGDMTKAEPPPAVVKALARVAAYAGATWQFDPRETAVLTSRGSPRYASGRRVELRRVFGHLETGQTACPGSLQDRLPAIRKGAAALLGPAPQLGEVTVTGAPVHAPLPLQVQATVSREAPWTASVRDADGRVVRTASGESTTAGIEWNGLVGLADTDRAVLPARPGTYTWALQVDDGYHRPARRTGTVTVGLPVVPVG